MHEWIQPAGIACDLFNIDAWVEQIRALEDEEVYKERSLACVEHSKSYNDTVTTAIGEIERLAREYPSSAPSQFKIQNAPAPSRDPPRVLTAIPQPPAGTRVGWQNGRLSFGRR